MGNFLQKLLIYTLALLIQVLPTHDRAKPILHSDRGWTVSDERLSKHTQGESKIKSGRFTCR